MAEKDESEAKNAECGGESDPINMEHYQAVEAGGGAPESPSSEHWDKVAGGHVGGSEEVVQGMPDQLDRNHLAEKDGFEPRLKQPEGVGRLGEDQLGMNSQSD
eukprot:2177443-Alexandrium_andersonii.AAC.1